MSFPRYEKYKESGVEWLGEVPDHWRIAPLYSLGKERDESNAGLISDNLLSLSYGRIIEKDIETSDGLLPESFETYQIVHPGDIIFRLTDLQNDKRSLRTAIVAELGIITFAYAAFEPRAIMPTYLNYLLRDYDLRKIFYSMGGGVRQSMKFDDIKRLPTLVPPKNEQSTVAKFLDYETAKIDALISEQRKLIELLKEKRQAVISYAVSKGLISDVKTTPSHVLGIGDVPAHWKVLRVRHVSVFTTSGPRGWSERINESGSTFVQSGDLDDALNIDFEGCKRVHVEAGAEASRTLLANGDVVVCITGAKTGNVAVCAGLEEQAYVNQHLCLIRTNNKILPRFLGLLLKSSIGQKYFEVSQYGLKQGLSLEDVREAPVLLPPLSEQQEICSFLDSDAKKFTELYMAAEDAVSLLQERRSALISATVTGKIDVRASVAKPVLSATQYSSGFAHQLLAAEILDRCNSQRMGRIKLQKLIHLCEYHGKVSEVQGDYSRKAAGPFDARAMAGISKNLKKQKWFEEAKEGERYVYRPLEKRGEHKKYLAHWQAEMPRIDEVLSLLGNFRTRECEIVSTLYAAWNDLLIDGASADDAAILHEASSAERWHKSKEQIAPERWTKALQWMKEKGLVPVGYGKHTRHTAGQIGPTTEEAHEPA
jgi:type I restriction enzyme, S subunit